MRRVRAELAQILSPSPFSLTLPCRKKLAAPHFVTQGPADLLLKLYEIVCMPVTR